MLPLVLLFLSCAHGLIVFERYQEPTCRTRVFPDAIPVLGINYAKYPFPWPGGGVLLEPLGRFASINATTVTFGSIVDNINGSCIDHAVFRYGIFQTVPGSVVMSLARKEDGATSSTVDSFKCINHQRNYWYTFAFPITTSNASGCPRVLPSAQFYIQRNNASIGSCSFSPQPQSFVSNCFDYSDPAVPICAPMHHCTCLFDADCSVPVTSPQTTNYVFVTNIGGNSVVDSVRVIDSNSLPPPKGTPPPTGTTSSGPRLVITAAWLFLFLTI
jgi:hypothetical protein